MSTVSDETLLACLPSGEACKATVEDDAVHLSFRSGPDETIPLGILSDIYSDHRSAPGHELQWYCVWLLHAKGNHGVDFLRRDDADAFIGRIMSAWFRNPEVNRWRRAIAERADELVSVSRRLEELRVPPQYLDATTFDELLSAARCAARGLEGKVPRVLWDAREVQALRTIRAFLDAPEYFRTTCNEVFVDTELERSRELFDQIEAHPLTQEQRRAVVVDERHNLVIAGAGSGKTSVIVSKAAWLVQRRFRKPSELLVLSYNRAACGELKERLRKRLGITTANNIVVRTFHGWGSEIIGKARGERPSVAAVATDSGHGGILHGLLDGLLAKVRDDPRLSISVLEWFVHLFAPCKSQHDFKNLGEYYNYLRRFDIHRALGGEKVKSFEEVVIANYLFCNGVRYEYESGYEHNTATSKRRQYTPDFFLPEYGIYIEHWGIDAHDRTASYVNCKKYVEDMAWKRQTHEQYRTALIETFSHERVDGKLLRNLKQKLTAHGVSMSSISPEQVFAVLQKQGRIRPFAMLVATFLRHFKGGAHSFSSIEKRAATQRDREDRARALAFLKLFRPIYERYEQALGGEVDFDDMINQATELVKAGRYRSPFRYVLVDEFQDISEGRARLLKALLDCSPGTKLLAVGDDWQAIYRFAGSDTSIMRGFGDRFDPFERSDLTITFRCSDRLATVARDFVLRNPAQIRKEVRADRLAAKPAVCVGMPRGHGRPLLVEALDRIARDAGGCDEMPSDVLLVSRYNRQEPKRSDMSTWERQYPSLRFNWTTMHRSKGLQTDYVVVLEMCAGRYGFPSEIEDDPLLSLVLAAPEPYPNAEERRLLYVAITRARRQAFLLADGDSLSPFVEELVNGNYDVEVFGRSPKDDAFCPRCINGRLIKRLNDQSGKIFFGCSNFPLCDFDVDPCLKCGTGAPVQYGDVHRCTNCDARIPSCPDCNGWLITKEGRFGRFLGCSTWPDCDHTRDWPQA